MDAMRRWSSGGRSERVVGMVVVRLRGLLLSMLGVEWGGGDECRERGF